MPHSIETVTEYCQALMTAAGLEMVHARNVAQVLVDADCFGHRTHGTALLGRYLDDMIEGRTTLAGNPVMLRDNGSTLLLDGNMLPGPAAMVHAIKLGLSRLGEHGAVSIVLRNSRHIACLASYLEKATSQGVLILIVSSNPGVRMVAPFGASRPTYSPNPLACGIPTEGDPVLVDISMSSVAANACQNLAARGEKLSGEYLVRPNGETTDDPGALFADPPAALLPLGGTDLGYKGFGMGLVIEALTSSLSGFGRSEPGVAVSNTTFIYLVDPQAFGGSEPFMRESSWFAEACQTAGDGNVRLPGERALAMRRRARQEGLSMEPAVLAALASRAERLGMTPLV